MKSKISVKECIDVKYREFWNYSNSNGKNSIDAREQLPEVVRKIIFASYKLNVRENDEHKTNELMGETGKYHAHGPSSIEDSIKGIATAYKSQKAIRVLEGVGNFGSAPGDEGAAGRYTNISGTPLLTVIYKDLPFVPYNEDDTGLSQPEYISVPLPIALIGGVSPIGTGKSCYAAEREATEVINWIDRMRKSNWKNDIVLPNPMSVTGCKTWLNNDNGYVYYDSIVHYGVDYNDLNKPGKFDVIVALPPKVTPDIVIYNLNKKLPTRVRDKILDGSGKGQPIFIIVPKGHIMEEDFTKYAMRKARIEKIFTWDHTLETMRESSVKNVAKDWFDDRCSVVTKRLSKSVDTLEILNHKINLIKIFAENGMVKWSSKDIIKYFVDLDNENGEKDANIVLPQSVRAFLPENLERNELDRNKNLKEIKALQANIKNIEDFVIKEAYDVIKAQEKFFVE